MPEMVPGSNVPLTREVPGLTGVVLGTSWDAGPERELEDNLVMAAILCDATGKALSDRHFVYFNQMVDPDLSAQAAERLKAAGVEVSYHVSRGVGHGISPDGLGFASAFISGLAAMF